MPIPPPKQEPHLLAACPSRYDGKHEERQGVVNHRRADRDGHGFVLRDAEAAGDRIREECMGGEHARHEHGGRPREAEKIHSRECAENLRDGEGQETEGDTPVSCPRDLVEIQLQPRQEHDVEQADLPEGDDEIPALDDGEGVRPQEGTADEQEDDVRHAHPLRQQRGEQDDAEEEGEHEDRIGQREHATSGD